MMSESVHALLSPTQFENLIFDLLSSMGLMNVRWRTPGADQGRDIEAEEVYTDFSGFHVIRPWYIECKRYKKSVDWPTIYAKVAYADNHDASHLLFCTTGKFTPRAISEVTKWNKKLHQPKIRLWPGNEIEQKLISFPDIRSKYGIDPPSIAQGKKLVDLSMALSKTIFSHYGEMVLSEVGCTPMLEAAQSISVLFRQRSEDIVRYKRIMPIIECVSDVYGDKCSGLSFKFDRFSFDALFYYLSSILSDEFVFAGSGEYSCDIRLSDEQRQEVLSCWPSIEALCFWGDIEALVHLDTLKIKQRTELAV